MHQSYRPFAAFLALAAIATLGQAQGTSATPKKPSNACNRSLPA